MADPIKVRELSDEQLADSVETSVREFLRDEAGAENAMQIGSEEVLWEHFDSLLVMELVVHLEERFGVQINTGKTSPEDLKTIARLREIAVKAIRAATT